MKLSVCAAALALGCGGEPAHVDAGVDAATGFELAVRLAEIYPRATFAGEPLVPVGENRVGASLDFPDVEAAQQGAPYALVIEVGDAGATISTDVTATWCEMAYCDPGQGCRYGTTLLVERIDFGVASGAIVLGQLLCVGNEGTLNGAP